MSNDWTSIGFISRAHGLKGEVVLEPEFDDDELYSIDRIFYLGKIGRDPVPVRIGEIKLVQKGDQLSFFVKFEHIMDRSDAEKIKGLTLFLPSDEVEVDEYTEDDYVGYQVIREDGSPEGEVVGILDNPAHILLEILGDEGSYFIPLVDEYVSGIDEKNRQLIVTDVSELKSLNG
ncbi:MAG TPA: 16S rRNA processing protein RimM [Bacteroidetes bacterium]|nr:16S rRNA processing protein RimM [Bacteroidota bacterium]